MAKAKSIFVDADAFIALNFYKHSSYNKAVNLAKKIDDLNLKVFTCTYTLLEAATVMNMYFEGRRGPEVVTEILENPQINTIKGDDFLEAGIKILKTQRSKNVSLNDCVYFAIVSRLKIDKVFSFDKHWKINGYQMLK